MILPLVRYIKARSYQKELVITVATQRKTWGWVDDTTAAQLELTQLEMDWHYKKLIFESCIVVVVGLIIMAVKYFIT